MASLKVGVRESHSEATVNHRVVFGDSKCGLSRSWSAFEPGELLEETVVLSIEHMSLQG